MRTWIYTDLFSDSQNNPACILKLFIFIAPTESIFTQQQYLSPRQLCTDYLSRFHCKTLWFYTSLKSKYSDKKVPVCQTRWSFFKPVLLICIIKIKVKICQEDPLQVWQAQNRSVVAIAACTILLLNLKMDYAAFLCSFTASHQRLMFIKLFPKQPGMCSNFLSLHVHILLTQLLRLGLSDLTPHIFLGTGFIFKGITISANFCIINHLLLSIYL